MLHPTPTEGKNPKEETKEEEINSFSTPALLGKESKDLF